MTIVDFCRDSQISFAVEQSDVVYTITYTGTGEVPSPTQTVTFATVSTDTDITRCPVTIDL